MPGKPIATTNTKELDMKKPLSPKVIKGGGSGTPIKTTNRDPHTLP